MDSVYRQQILIQLGVDGDYIIDSVRRRLDQLKDTMQDYAEKVKNHQLSQQDYLLKTEYMAEDMVRLNDILKLSAGTVADVQGRMQGAAYAVLALSHAAQDFVQSGFPAVINNIPQISFGIGQLAGWSTQMNVAISGISMLVGLVGNTAAPYIRQVYTEFGILTDHSKDAANSVDGLKTRLDALEGKMFKVGVDYEQIDDAKRAIEELKALLAAYKGLRATDVDAESGKAAKEAVTVYGGGADRLAAIVGQVDQVEGVDRVSGATRKQIKELEKSYNFHRGVGDPRFIIEGQQLEALKAQAKEEARNNLLAEVASFGQGDFQAIERMKGRIERRGDLFGDLKGPGGLTFAEYVQNMAGNAPEMRRRMDQDADLDAMFDQDAAQGAAFKQNRSRRQTEQKRQDAETKRVEKEKLDALKDWTREDERMGDRAKDQAEKDRKREQREILKRSRDAMKRARGVAADFDDGMEDDLMQAMLQRGLAGKGVEGLDRQVMQKMIAAGVNPNDALAASQIMVEDTKTKMNARLTGMGGLNRNNAINLLAEMSQKQAVRDLNAGNREARLTRDADQNNLAGQFQMNGFNAGASETLAKKTLQLMNQGVELQQAQTIAIQELQRQMQQMQAKLNRNAQQMQRGRQRGNSLLPVLIPNTR